MDIRDERETSACESRGISSDVFWRWAALHADVSKMEEEKDAEHTQNHLPRGLRGVAQTRGRIAAGNRSFGGLVMEERIDVYFPDIKDMPKMESEISPLGEYSPSVMKRFSEWAKYSYGSCVVIIAEDGKVKILED